MRLSQLFTSLASGELSNLYLADGGNGILKKDKQALVLLTINLGLLDLYTRFFLKRKSKDIKITTQKTYELDDEECLEIVEVSLDKIPLQVNVDFIFENPKSIRLLKDKQGTLNFEYKAKHKTLTQEDIDNDTLLELPLAYSNALLYFCGHRLLTSLPNQLDGDLAESQRYYQKYLAEIASLTQIGVDVDDLNDKWLFHDRGFI